MSFVRHEIPVAPETDLRFPAPVTIDDRTTVLYANRPYSSGGRQLRALVAMVSPASVHFAPTDE
jgi:hypothetical protein